MARSTVNAMPVYVSMYGYMVRSIADY